MPWKRKEKNWLLPGGDPCAAQQKKNNRPVEKKKKTQQFKTVGFLPVQRRHWQKIKNNQPAQKNTRKKIGFSSQQKTKTDTVGHIPTTPLKRKEKNWLLRVVTPVWPQQKKNNQPVLCKKIKKQSTCAKNKRKKWLLLGGDPFPNTASLAAAAIKNKEQLTCTKKKKMASPGW